jgi:hypothetical protein
MRTSGVNLVTINQLSLVSTAETLLKVADHQVCQRPREGGEEDSNTRVQRQADQRTE